MLATKPYLEIYEKVKWNAYIGIKTNNYLTAKYTIQLKQT